MTVSGYQPFVSVIIPVYNSEKTLDQCLSSLLQLDYDHNQMEFIVVDNGSTDRSAEIAQTFNANLIYKPDGTISSVRNFGADIAKGEVFAFVDSDCLVTKKWLVNALLVLNDKSVAVTGSGYSTPENNTWVEKAWLFEKTGQPFETNFLPGGNLLVRADIFRKVSGFDEKLVTCEDSDFCYRVKKSGFKVINSPKIKTIHLGNSKTISQFIKKEYWYGTSSIDNFIDTPFDKITWLTALFGIFSVLLVAAICLYGFNNNPNLIYLSSFILVSILLLSTLVRISKSNKYSYFFHVFLLYIFYYAARVCAMALAIKKKLLHI